MATGFINGFAHWLKKKDKKQADAVRETGRNANTIWQWIHRRPAKVEDYKEAFLYTDGTCDPNSFFDIAGWKEELKQRKKTS